MPVLKESSQKECFAELEPFGHFQKSTGVLIISNSIFELMAICVV